jgi:hypothetical protein
MCVACHSRIDPDIVNAGHPTLDLELFTMTQRQPAHHYARNTYDGVRSWAVGLAISARENATAFTKLARPSQDDLEALFLSLQLKLRFIEMFPKRLRNISKSSKISRLLKKMNKSSENVQRSQLIKDLRLVTGELNKLAKRLAERDSKSRHFDQTGSKIFAERIISKTSKDFDEYEAAATANALLALYNSYIYGKGPRFAKANKTPKEFKELLVRPNIYEPESLFDDEGEFRGSIWSGRHRLIKKLFRKNPRRQ